MGKIKFIIPIIMLAVLLGCAGDTSPLTPSPETNLPPQSTIHEGKVQTHLWGYYDVYIDIENEAVEIVSSRSAMFTCNVVNYLNSGAGSYMGFVINNIITETDYKDIDIDVIMTHPFPGYPQYNGCDVRGVFMGDGSEQMAYNNDLVYPVLGTDQFMFADPDPAGDDSGAPDGYTRWFNISEFADPVMELFGYTPGKLAPPGFAGTATLCPYKYFADGLEKDEDLCTWMETHPGQNGQFSTGATNSRNYYLRFPNDIGLQFGYAVIASWGGTEPEYHPSNAPEAVACDVVNNSTVYYINAGDNGGNLIFDISLYGWGYQPSTIYLESTVLSSVYEFTAEMIPTGGDVTYSTYHVDIPADIITGNDGNEYWVIAEYADFDYSNEFGVLNDAWDDHLAAVFRYDLAVSTEYINQPPNCDLVVVYPEMPYEGPAVLAEFDASGSSDPDGTIVAYEWDFNGDDVYGDSYDAGTDSNPQKYYYADYFGQVCVRVQDDYGDWSEPCCVDMDITIPFKNIPIRDVDAYDIAVDHANGDLLILYSDGEVWKHTEADSYQTGSNFFTVAVVGVDRIDISPNSYIQVVGAKDMSIFDARSYTPTGSDMGFNGWAEDFQGLDAVGLSASDHGYENYHMIISLMDLWGWHLVTFTLSPDFTYHTWMARMWPQGYGDEAFVADLVMGCEASSEPDQLYFVETDPENRVERVSTQGIHDDLAWGIPKLNWPSGNNPLDISRDDNNDYYVLGTSTGGDPEMRKFTSTGTVLGTYGDSTTIIGDPLRIEGSDYNGNMFVLHGHYISIFFPEELTG